MQRVPIHRSLAVRHIPVTTARRRISTINRDLSNQTLPLQDGRVLGFAEYGCQTGYPLLFFHGFPSSRLEASSFDALARFRHLRVIAPERPGFGLSTFQPGRRITDYPADVTALVEHLGLSRFAILGGSGGGPYALACAQALPHDTMSSVGLMASAGPWEAGVDDVLLSARVTSWLATKWPVPLAAVTNLLVDTARRGLATPQGTKLIERMQEKANSDSSAKKETEGRPSVEEVLQMLFEGFAQGAEACVQEARLLTGDWGIRFEDVDYESIQMWHGTKDKNSPISMVRYMAERLPHSSLHEFEGDNHFAIVRHLGDILSELVAEKEKESLGCRTKV